MHTHELMLNKTHIGSKHYTTHFASFCKREFLEVGNREEKCDVTLHGSKIFETQQSFLTGRHIILPTTLTAFNSLKLAT